MESNMNFKIFRAFTLAEVLITLGIVGVVASMIIPTLISNYQAKVTVNALKKGLSAMSQAYARAIQETGTPDIWGLSTAGSSSGATNILNGLAPYLNVTKNCGVNAGCIDGITYLFLDGTNPYTALSDNTMARAQLNDGTILFTFSMGGNCDASRGSAAVLQNNICGVLNIDVNGLKKPNKEGADVFEFYITKKNGIIPRGMELDSTSFQATCQNSVDGRGCAAWALYNENMDYLKNCGSTLAWGGVLSCN